MRVFESEVYAGIYRMQLPFGLELLCHGTLGWAIMHYNRHGVYHAILKGGAK